MGTSAMKYSSLFGSCIKGVWLLYRNDFGEKGRYKMLDKSTTMISKNNYFQRRTMSRPAANVVLEKV